MAVMEKYTHILSLDLFPVQVCQDLGNAISGGTVHYSQSLQQGGYPEGSTATVMCNYGYAGGGDITCQSESWSGNLPGCVCKLSIMYSCYSNLSCNYYNCVVVDCGAPPALRNGAIISQSGTTFGSVVTYECNKFFQFADESRSKSCTCLASGSWSNEEALKCGKTD